MYTLNLRTPSPCSPMLEENKISNIKCSYNYTVLYFVSIVCLLSYYAIDYVVFVSSWALQPIGILK